MGKVGRAIAGVAASAAVAGGSYATEVWSGDKEVKAAAECAQNYEEGDAREDCIERVEGIYDPGEGVGLLQFVGVVGMIGCGYIGYKGLKEENDTTGIIDDHINIS